MNTDTNLFRGHVKIQVLVNATIWGGSQTAPI